MIRYKINVIEELSKRGYTSPVIREKKVLSQSTLQHIRTGKPITTESLNIICLILRMQPGDIIEVVPTDEEKIKYF